MAPDWLTAFAWSYLSVCFCCAGLIVYDIAGNARRQPMGVMNFVFPITALYLGPLALAFYLRRGRAATRTAMPPVPVMSLTTPASVGVTAVVGGMSVRPLAHHAMAGAAHPTGTCAPVPARPIRATKPGWVSTALDVSHCGSGCTLGDVISEFAIFGFGLTNAGSVLGAEYVGDFVLALALGIIFQYFAIAPMRGLTLKDGLVAAAKADFISLTAFEVGLFGWMSVMAFVLYPAPHHLMASSAAYWLLMQVGMIIGFVTAWPANVWLVKRGVKVPM
jgi:hypothetical protein